MELSSKVLDNSDLNIIHSIEKADRISAQRKKEYNTGCSKLTSIYGST